MSTQHLVICKRLSAAMSRPKYHSVSKHPQWVVFNTNTKKTVFGPVSRNLCQKYMDGTLKE